MKRSDLPQYETTKVESKVTGRVGTLVLSPTTRQKAGLNRKQVLLKDSQTGEIYSDNLADLGYEPSLEYPEINWGPHSISYFGDINLEMWIAFPEYPGIEWYGTQNRYSEIRKEGKISKFIGWLEAKYQRDANDERIFGSRGGFRIYYCTVYVDRLPNGLEAFVADVENKIAELIKNG